MAPGRLGHARFFARTILVGLATWLQHRLGVRPSFLPVLLVIVTNRCNLRCRTCGICYQETAAAGRSELTTDEWKAVFRSAGRLRTLLVDFTGGEPLLRRDICDLIGCARDNGMAVHLCSSGTPVTRSMAERLADSGLDSISISLDTPDPAVQDWLRGDGVFERATAAIGLLRESAPSIDIGINCTVTNRNHRTLAEMVPFAEGLGVDQIKFAPLHSNLLHRDKPEEELAGLVFRGEQITELEHEVDRLAQALGRSRLRTASAAFLTGMPGLYRGTNSVPCMAGYAACTIDPLGAVGPCADLLTPFSVRDRPLEEIWRSRELNAQRGRVRRCSAACWDPVNTELSLKLRPRSIAHQLRQTWRDVGFYVSRGPG